MLPLSTEPMLTYGLEARTAVSPYHTFSKLLTLKTDYVVDEAGIEPAASTMPTLRSARLIYSPIDILHQTRTLLSVMGK